jgi:hypothetical protein
MNAGKNIKFGQLLIQLGLIAESDLNDSLQVAPQFGLPLGRTLVLSGKLTEEELQLAVELQPLVSNSNCPLDKACRAAAIVRNHGITANQALQKIGVHGITDKATLGRILLDAGCITQGDLDNAQKISYESGMRLGKVLTLNKAISHNLLTKALDLQQMVRQNRLTLGQAVDMLRSLLPKESTVSLKLEGYGLKPHPAKKQVRFGEFLVMSGLATESEILNAMETSLSKQLSLGEAIVSQGIISEKLFREAERLHGLVCFGSMQLSEATDAVYKLIFKNDEGLAVVVSPAAPETCLQAPAPAPEKKSVPEIKAEEPVESKSPVLGELLKMTGFVNDADISEAIELSSRYPSLIGKMLVISGAIDEATLIASLRCQYLLKHGHLTVEQAVQALQYTRQHKISFDDALDELGLSKGRLPN